MAEADLGTRDARGEWQPAELIQTPPVFVWPSRPLAFLKWLFGFPGYLMPYNVFFMAVAIVSWLFLTPEMERMTRFEPGWDDPHLPAQRGDHDPVLRCLAPAALHPEGAGQALQVQQPLAQHQQQGIPVSQPDPRQRVLEPGERLRCLVAVRGRDAVDVRQRHLPYVDFRTNPVYFVLLLAAVQMMREVHFYWVHA